MLKNGLFIFCLFFCFNATSQTILDMPATKSFGTFKLIKVSPSYNELDYLALMASKEFIHDLLGSEEWPSHDLTKEQNLESLVNDLKQFGLGENFTFHIFNQSKQIIGCIYLTPNVNGKNERYFESFFWLTPEYQNDDMTAKIKNSVTQWLLNIARVKSVKFSLN